LRKLQSIRGALAAASRTSQPSYKSLAPRLSEVSPLIIVSVQVKKALRDFPCVGVRFLAEVWFVLIGMERACCRRPEHRLPPFGDRGDNEARNAPNCVYITSPGFLANFWQMAF